jgi:hypothetical protein
MRKSKLSSSGADDMNELSSVPRRGNRISRNVSAPGRARRLIVALALALLLASWIALSDRVTCISDGRPSDASRDRPAVHSSESSHEPLAISRLNSARTRSALRNSNNANRSDQLPTSAHAEAGSGAIAGAVVARGDLQSRWAGEPSEVSDTAGYETAVVAALGVDPAAVLDADCRSSVCRLDVVRRALDPDLGETRDDVSRAEREVTTVYYPLAALSNYKH